MLGTHDTRISIHLASIRDLFNIPIIDPFAENMRLVSGIEFIKEKIRPAWFHRHLCVRTTIFLPEQCIEPDLAYKTSAAVRRYCRYQLRQNKIAISLLLSDALKALCIGIIFLASGLFFSQFINVGFFLANLLNDGFNLAFWVILWRPVDFFLFDLPGYWREKSIYQAIMDMDIIICPEK
jgi:hypothetical protein